MSDTVVFRQFSQFLQSIEDGQFHQDISDAMNKINTALTEHVIEYGGKPGASLSIRLKFKAEKGVVSITPEFDVTLPKAPRGSATMWQTAEGFTPFNPKQMEMFNGKPRAVEDGSDVKSI